jgi:hypothetical protein
VVYFFLYKCSICARNLVRTGATDCEKEIRSPIVSFGSLAIRGQDFEVRSLANRHWKSGFGYLRMPVRQLA